MNNRWTVSIAAPPEKVWSFVADLGKHAQWSPKDYSVVSHDDKEEWTNRFELEPSGTGTTVTKTMTGPPLTGVRKAMFEVIFALFVRGPVQKGMDMLKAKV